MEINAGQCKDRWRVPVAGDVPAGQELPREDSSSGHLMFCVQVPLAQGPEGPCTNRHVCRGAVLCGFSEMAQARSGRERVNKESKGKFTFREHGAAVGADEHTPT